MDIKTSIVPGFINKERFNPIVPSNGKIYILSEIMKAISVDLEAELNLPKIRIDTIYGDIPFGDDGGYVGMYTSFPSDNSPYIVNIINNVLEYVKCDDIFTSVLVFCNLLAHEYRHVWQSFNNSDNKYKFTKLLDEEYIENYDSVNYEVDAEKFANLYVDSRYYYIESLFVNSLNNYLMNNTIFLFDIYRFIEYLISKRRTTFEIISRLYAFDATVYDDINIYPLYDNTNIRFSSYVDDDSRVHLNLSTNLHWLYDNIHDLNVLYVTITNSVINVITLIYSCIVHGDYYYDDIYDYRFDLVKSYLIPIINKYLILNA